MGSPPKWGILPQALRQLVVAHEWDNRHHLKARLRGARAFPLSVSLKPPSSRTALEDLAHFRTFVHQWQHYPEQAHVQWELRSYRTLGAQRVPCAFILTSMAALIAFVGCDATARSARWRVNMAPLLALNHAGIYALLIKHLETLETISLMESEALANTVTQLHRDMGRGEYLRALPLVGVDTKFLEIHEALITDLLDCLHEGALTKAGGLRGWLGCVANPKGWLWVRPLCALTKERLGGMPILQLPYELLQCQALPAPNIVVVENVQAGLGLPELAQTIAVFGGGKNVAWMHAPWLASRKVAYWGDIDSWGLEILSRARCYCPTLSPLMMDEATLLAFQTRMVDEETHVEHCPQHLTPDEEQLFFNLKAKIYGATRLEQERLSPDYIRAQLQAWLSD